MAILSPLRLLVLLLAICAFVIAVIWHDAFQRAFLQPMLHFAFVGRRVPALLSDPRIGRVWNILMFVLLLFLWWILGTPAATRLFARQ